MTKVGGVAGDQLKAIIERIERLEEEKSGLAALALFGAVWRDWQMYAIIPMSALSSVAAASSSMSKVTPDIDFDDLQWKTREYNEVQAYCSSKLANYLHAARGAEIYPVDQLICVSVHPGWVQSNLDVHFFDKTFGTSWLGSMMANAVRQIFLWKGDMISAVDGAQTTLYCLLEDASKIQNGKFYSQFGIYQDKKHRAGGWPLEGEFPNPNATPEKAKTLWELSEKLVQSKA